MRTGPLRRRKSKESRKTRRNRKKRRKRRMARRGAKDSARLAPLAPRAAFSLEPEALCSLVGQQVRLDLRLGAAPLVGDVHSVDPVSGSFLLITQYEQKYSLNFIPSTHIASYTALGPSQTLVDLALDTPAVCTPEESALNRERVLKAISNNCVPYEESQEGVISIESVLRIFPPYRPENCLSTNLNVLCKIKKMLFTEESQV